MISEIAMGGSGSGGGRSAMKTSSLFSIDLIELRRAGLKRPGSTVRLERRFNDGTGDMVLIVLETNRLRIQDLDPPGYATAIWRSIRLTFTNQEFGGRRAWMSCPACSGRCRIVYRDNGGAFACRRCLGATYPSQYEPWIAATANRAARIRRRLGGAPLLNVPFAPRPKHMRRATYDRLCAEVCALEEKIDARLDELMAGL